jgi:nucleoid DNA-binding protein
MSKKLVEKIAATLGCTRKDAADALKAVTGGIQEICKEEGSTTIVNFGTFSIKHYNRNSKLNGVEYKVDKNVVRFKAGAGFSRAIN